MSMAARNIVVVGGGFAGTTLVQSLQRELPEGWRLLLVSEESYTTFNPMLAEVVGAAVFPEHVVAPIRQMIDAPCTQFVMGRALDVDFGRKLLRASTLAGVQDIPFEHLVLAVGTRANTALVPGLADHALPLKLVGDALHIRNRVLQRIARIELEGDPVARRRLGHFVVIGGGFSGVEVAGSLSDFLRGARRFYPRVARDELKVTLLQDGERLLPELPESLGRSAARSLMARGVDVRLAARAARVEADGVVLADGARIDAATVVCTIGTRPNPFVEQLDVPLQRGRIVTGRDLSVPGRSGVWALGDCALVRNGDCALVRNGGCAPGHNGGEQFAPPTAQFAVAEAHALARNLLAVIAQRPTEDFSHRSRGMMATTGHLKGVAQVGRLRFGGLPAWLLWRAYYLLRMPTAGRKLRIWVEWTWAMAFAADITHLRFTRTAEADAEAAQPLK
jgi:NADH dehydrogenase